ncbi:MAG: chemotaxis protein CheC [Candidatus Heimdallarchaeota archaeon]|nr:MAG: chemotaxis protein CheC [Candidatus Heimdallarchaeota archaeon]
MHDTDFQMEKLSDFHLDALQEVGNIGAGHAAIALTQFLNRSTYMSIPKVALKQLQDIPGIIGMPIDQELAIISSVTVSDLLYTILVFFDWESVKKIIDLMTSQQTDEIHDIRGLPPLFRSLIKETGSILSLKYIEALNYFLKANSFPSPPKLRIGTLVSCAEHELDDIRKNVKSVLFIECDVFTSERNIAVDLAIVPHLETFEEFMKSLFGEESSII